MSDANPYTKHERLKILSKNKGINKSTVAAHERLELELKQLGVEIKPRFNLEPPLGESRNGCFNQNVKS